MMFDWIEPWAHAALAWDIHLVSQSGPTAWMQCRDHRLREMLAFAATRSAFYADAPPAAADEAALHWLARWPVVRKRELMRRFDDCLTDRSITLAALRSFMADPSCIGKLYDGRVMAWGSSGSSGTPGVFVHDAQALRVYDQLECQRRPPAAIGVGPIAFVGATQGHFASVCTIERLRRLGPLAAACMRSFSFMQPIAQLVDQLNAYRPAVLASYPSTASLLAEEQRAGRLAIRPLSIWTGGETLTPAVRRQVEQTFAAPVVDSYGASEFLAIGSQCHRGAMHLNADWVVLEPVDAQMRPVAAGAFGATTLLTNLANHLQPLIRYDIGDRVRIDPQPCACGSPLPVIEVEGRSDDCLMLRDAQGHRVRLPPLALVSVLEDVGVFDFQLQQRSDSRLCLRLARHGTDAELVSARARNALMAYLGSHGLGRTTLDVRCDEPSHRGRSGKTRRILAAGATS